MARVTDATGIQFRRLNPSKGPAVRATRVQCDKARYRTEMRRVARGAAGSRPQAGRGRRASSSRSATARVGRGVAHHASGVGLSARARWSSPPAPSCAAASTSATQQHDGGRAGEAPRARPVGVARVARLSAGAAQDRHALPPRRAHHRLARPRGAARRRAAAALRRRRSGAAAAAARPATSPTPPQATHALIRANLHRSPLYGPSGALDRHRAALLPVDRGQGRALRRQAAPPDLPRARGARHRTRSTPTASRPRCPSTCSSRSCAPSPASSAPR